MIVISPFVSSLILASVAVHVPSEPTVAVTSTSVVPSDRRTYTDCPSSTPVDVPVTETVSSSAELTMLSTSSVASIAKAEGAVVSIGVVEDVVVSTASSEDVLAPSTSMISDAVKLATCSVKRAKFKLPSVSVATSNVSTATAGFALSADDRSNTFKMSTLSVPNTNVLPASTDNFAATCCAMSTSVISGTSFTTIRPDTGFIPALKNSTLSICRISLAFITRTELTSIFSNPLKATSRRSTAPKTTSVSCSPSEKSIKPENLCVALVLFAY